MLNYYFSYVSNLVYGYVSNISTQLPALKVQEDTTPPPIVARVIQETQTVEQKSLALFEKALQIVKSPFVIYFYSWKFQDPDKCDSTEFSSELKMSLLSYIIDHDTRDEMSSFTLKNERNLAVFLREVGRIQKLIYPDLTSYYGIPDDHPYRQILTKIAPFIEELKSPDYFTLIGKIAMDSVIVDFVAHHQKEHSLL